MREVGALLEARSVHTGRTAYNHLLALAQTAGIPRSRVDEVVDLVGLHEVARKRAGGFSLGMGQRLGIASALLGDPHTLLLDEPVNGLDPDGIRWMRNLLKALAAEGRTVFVSSHLMSEMAQTAEHLIVIGRGRLIADTSVEDFIARSSGNHVRVRTTEPARLAAVLESPDVTVQPLGGDALEVSGLTTDQVGLAAGSASITLLELTAQQTSLEDAFMQLTQDAVEFHGTAAVPDRVESIGGTAMSATAETRRPGPTGAVKPVTQARVVLSEWTKLRSLRSTVFSFLAAVVIVIGSGRARPVGDGRALAATDPQEARGLRPDDAGAGRDLPRPAGRRGPRRAAHHR